MDNPSIDIIVSIWNRPVETRNCLVNLIEHSPLARFILVDNGSDRETERLLQEFAEILDHRALLLRNNTNQGYVRAVNRGLARAEAPLLAVVRNTSIVTEGWMESSLKFSAAESKAGILVPRLIPVSQARVGKIGNSQAVPRETDHGSFAAMIVRKRLHDLIGGFDEEMDGGTWCLRDYSRRAFRSGFFTYSVETGTVRFEDEITFGSAERREQATQRSIAAYRERWGDGLSFCLYFPKGTDMNILRQKLAVLQQGARQGHSFSILMHSRLFKDAEAAGLDRLHEQIRFYRLPLFFENKTIQNQFTATSRAESGIRAVTGIDGIPFPAGIDSISFTQLESDIAANQAAKYGT